MWGIIPAAGKGSRIQPLAFSKELLPVGSRYDGQTERPLAVSEYLVERMIQAARTRSASSSRPASPTFSNTTAAKSIRRMSATPSRRRRLDYAMRSFERSRSSPKTSRFW